MTTSTLTLTDFLLARITEDEEAARAGISSQADPENGWGYGGYGSPTALTPHVGISHERVQAEHIIRWHPARVLAECEAKRNIVERTDPRAGMNAAFEPSPVVEWIHRQMALPYTDHPDYRDEWRP